MTQGNRGLGRRSRGPAVVRPDPLPAEPHAVGVTEVNGDRRLGWAAFGDPEGDTVFWFHGSPGARSQIPPSAVAEAEARGIRLVGVERPGTGDSTSHRYRRIVDFADDFRHVADDLGAERFGLVGLSGGGPYVLAVAHELPDRAAVGVVLGGIGPTRGSDAIVSYTLLLVPAAPVIEWARAPLARGAAAAVRSLGPAGGPFLDAFFNILPGERHHMGADHDSKRQMLGDLVDAAHRSGVESPFDDLILFGRHWGFRLDRIRVPIWFWAGTSDIIVPYRHAERQAKRVPDARLRTVQGRGHFAGYTTPVDVLDAIRQDWPRTEPVQRARAASRRGRPAG